MEYGKILNSQVRKRYGYGIIFKSGVRGTECWKEMYVIFKHNISTTFLCLAWGIPFLRITMVAYVI